MKLHLPVKLRASLIAAVVAVSAAVYNHALAVDNVGASFDFNNTFSSTAGNTYTATGDITFESAQGDMSAISGDTTLTAGGALNIKNNFGPSTVDMTTAQDPTYKGNLNVVAKDIVLSDNVQAVMEDVSAEADETIVGKKSDLVILNGDVDAENLLVDDGQPKKTLQIEDLKNSGTFTPRPAAETAVNLGIVTGAGNLTVIGDTDETDTVAADSIGAAGNRFGNINAANTELTVTGDVVATSIAQVGGSTEVGGNIDTTALYLAVDSTLTASEDIEAGAGTGSVTIYGDVVSEQGDITLHNGNTANLNGIHAGATVTAEDGTVTLDAVNVTEATVTASEDVVLSAATLADGATVTDSEITAGEDMTITNYTVDGATLNVGDDLTITGSEITGTEATVGDNVSIDDSKLTDTNVKGLTGDIKIANGSVITSTTEDGFAMSTSGTSADNGYDAITGGSIIIDNAAVSKGTITSGKDVDAAENPHGDISVTDAQVDEMTLSTAKGNIILTGTHQEPATITPNNNSNGCTGFTTSLATLGVTGTADTQNVLTISVQERTGGTAQGTGVYLQITDADGNVVATSTNSVDFGNAGAMKEFSFEDVPALDANANYTFNFVDADGAAVNCGLRVRTGDTILSPITGHDAWSAIVTSETISNSISKSTITTGSGDITANGSLVSDSEIATDHGAVSVTDSVVIDSAISTKVGSVTITDSTVKASDARFDENDAPVSSITSDLNGTLTVSGSTISKTSITATGVVYNTEDMTDPTKAVLAETSTITDSTVSDSDITLSEDGADLIITGSTVNGQTNIDVADTVTITGTSAIAMDGGEDDRYASITADKLNVESADGHASLTNGQIAIDTETVISDAQTLDLTNVNSGEGETAGTLGNLVEASGDATLNIVNSTIDIDAVYSNDSTDVKSSDHYFSSLNVGKDSTVKIAEDAYIKNYNESRWDGQSDTTGAGSSVTFEKDATIKNAYLVGNNDRNTETTVNGEAHVGTLKLQSGSTLSIVNADTDGGTPGTLDTPVTDKQSYIAEIRPGDGYGAPHGTVNVVGGTLTTPKLSSDYLTIGLNGGIIELGDVTAEQGATTASSDAVSAAVKVNAITDAAVTGMNNSQAALYFKLEQALTSLPPTTPSGYPSPVDGHIMTLGEAKAYVESLGMTDTIGASTIRTTVDRVVTPYSYDNGTASTVTAHTYYYVAIADGTLTNGTVVKAGDIITRTDTELTYFTKADGTTVPNGYTTDVTGATTLDANDSTLLTRVTQALLDENGDLLKGVAKNGDLVIALGQVYTETTLDYQDGVAENVGTLTTVTDGIASLSVKGEFSANQAVINAYETGTVDAGTGIVSQDADTGFIKIGGALSGDSNSLFADNDITINSITGTDNIITSNRGDVTIEAASSDADNTVIQGRNIKTADFAGDSVVLGAEGDITTGDLTGSEDVLTAEGNIATGSITGDTNMLAAEGTITTGAIKGNDNVLDADDAITTGAIEGNTNTLTSDTTITTDTITGDSNALTAEGTITTGAIKGNDNVLDADDAITTGAIEGNTNTLTSDTTITTDTITGDSNALTAVDTITTGAIKGNDNVLDAGDTITTDAIEGNTNTLTSDTTITTDTMTGDSNALTAVDTITTGAINGNANTLDAGDAITTGAIEGNTNTLTSAKGDITTGVINGAQNSVSAHAGNVVLGGVDGSENTVTAQGTADIDMLSGKNQSVTVYANGKGATDEVIHIGTFNAEGTVVGISGSTDPVYGTGSNNGSIVIDEMCEVGDEADATLLSKITSNTGSVTVNDLNGSDAFTQIKATTGDVILGSTTSGQDSASNLTVIAQNVEIASSEGLTLDDSVIKTTGDISGTDLTLDAADSVFTSTAANVNLDNLTISGTAALTVSGSTQVDDTLTIDGTKATLNCTDVTTKKLSITNNGSLGANVHVTADELAIKDSTFAMGSLNGVKGLTLDNAQGSISQALTGLTEEITLKNGSELNMDNALGTSSDITVTDSALKASTLTAGGDTTVTNGTLIAGTGKLSTSALTATNSTVNTAAGIDMKGDLTAADSTITGAISNADNVTLSGSETGKINMDGALVAADSTTGAITGTVSTADISDSSIGSGLTTTGAATVTDNSKVKGDLIAGGAATIADSTIEGAISGTETQVTNSSATQVTAATGSATVENSAITGDITGSTNASIKGGSAANVLAQNGNATAEGNATVKGNLTAANGTVSVTDSAVEGALSGQSATVTNSSAASVAATTGAATVTDGTIAGAITAATDATVKGGSAGSVSAEGIAKVTDASVTGTITGADTTVTNSSAASVAATTGAATVTDGTIAGAITAATDATITGTTADSVAAKGTAQLTDSTIKGAVTAAENATVIGGSAASVSAEAVATVTGAAIAGTVEGKEVVLTNGTAATVKATDSAAITTATVGAVEAAGADVTLDSAATGEIAADSLTVESSSSTGAVTTKGLTVKSGTTLTAAGALAADGPISIEGDVTATAIDLTGASGSVISGADVKATTGDTALAGSIAADNTTISGDKVAVNGTLDAAEGTVINGTLTGNGTINKTGGDALVISDADATVAINVTDDSTLALANGTKVGAVNLMRKGRSIGGATLVIGTPGTVDTATMSSLTLDTNSNLTLDTDLNALAIDTVDASKAALNGATITLSTTGDESAVADQTRLKFVSGTVTSGAGSVEHDMVTLNAYADGNTIVLSQNYRGVKDLTKNQKSTATALTDIEDHTAPSAQMADVIEALHETRSAAESKKALDTLSGAGLAAISKMVSDDTHEHIQTLRATMKSLSAGVTSRYDANGQRIADVQSSAVSASVTGGTTHINSDDNAAAYNRNSFGCMIAGVHALSDSVTGGLGLAYSHAEADCGIVDLGSDGLYLDVAAMHKGARVTQTVTLGCGHFDISTDRNVNFAGVGHAEGSTSATAVNVSYEAVATVLSNEEETQMLSAVFQADAMYAQFDGFTETGVGNAGVTADIDDVTSAIFGIGARYTANFGEKTNPGYFMAEALFVAEAGDREAKINNRFISGGPSFELNGPDAGACGLRLNAGVLVPVSEQTALFGNVSSEFRADQSSVSGGVGLKYAF